MGPSVVAAKDTWTIPKTIVAANAIGAILRCRSCARPKNRRSAKRAISLAILSKPRRLLAGSDRQAADTAIALTFELLAGARRKTSPSTATSKQSYQISSSTASDLTTPFGTASRNAAGLPIGLGLGRQVGSQCASLKSKAERNSPKAPNGRGRPIAHVAEDRYMPDLRCPPRESPCASSLMSFLLTLVVQGAGDATHEI